MANRFTKATMRKKLSGLKGSPMKKDSGGHKGETEFKTQKNTTPKQDMVGKKAGDISVGKGGQRNSKHGGTTGM